MDKVENFKKAIKTFLEEQGSFTITNMPDVKSRVVMDEQHHQYLLIWTGFKGVKYIYRIWYHFEIVKDKIIVLENKTDVDLAEELEYLGVNRKDIMANWAPKHIRDAA